MDEDGWVEEMHEMWAGQKFCLKMKKQLFRQKSAYQDVAVYESETYGNVLTLDGIIQCSERDEAAYSEMMAHVPLCSLKDPPERVLVVGGGDGGVVRELTKYDSIQSIDVAEIDNRHEIDRMVVDVSKAYLPKMSVGFDDPRVRLQVTDGCAFVARSEEGFYDAVIVDSSDPIGPAVVLYTTEFYSNVHRALKPGGVVCSMAECMWLHMHIIERMAKTVQEAFKGGCVQYSYTCVPTYPCGQIGMMVGLKYDPDRQKASPQIPKRLYFQDGKNEDVPLQYYNAKIHEASFALPEFVKKKLECIIPPP